MKNEQEVQFVDELPPRRYGDEGKWIHRLKPLLQRPGVWALVHTSENPLQATKLQANLHMRKVYIPEPRHHWEFAARGCEVYAIYRGKKRRQSSASVR